MTASFCDFREGDIVTIIGNPDDVLVEGPIMRVEGQDIWISALGDLFKVKPDEIILAY